VYVLSNVCYDSAKLVAQESCSKIGSAWHFVAKNLAPSRPGARRLKYSRIDAIMGSGHKQVRAIAKDSRRGRGVGRVLGILSATCLCQSWFCQTRKK
jgi:hypothetical protein